MDNRVIGSVSVEVKAGLSVDARTAKVCSDLVSIRLDQIGVKAAIVRGANDDGGLWLLGDDEVKVVQYALSRINKILDMMRGDETWQQ